MGQVRSQTAVLCGTSILSGWLHLRFLNTNRFIGQPWVYQCCQQTTVQPIRTSMVRSVGSQAELCGNIINRYVGQIPAIFDWRQLYLAGKAVHDGREITFLAQHESWMRSSILCQGSPTCVSGDPKCCHRRWTPFCKAGFNKHSHTHHSELCGRQFGTCMWFSQCVYGLHFHLSNSCIAHISYFRYTWSSDQLYGNPTDLPLTCKIDWGACHDAADTCP